MDGQQKIKIGVEGLLIIASHILTNVPCVVAFPAGTLKVSRSLKWGNILSGVLLVWR